jgi:hypothetical protein
MVSFKFFYLEREVTTSAILPQFQAPLFNNKITNMFRNNFTLTYAIVAVA